MAGDWIAMRTNLDTDPRVIAMATELNIGVLDVVGKLWKVWAWADCHSLDGNALDVTCVTLDRFVDCAGFADSLRNIGWLEGRDRALTLPRFTEWNGQTAKKRAQTRKRVANHRNGGGVTGVTHGALPQERTRQSLNKKENARAGPESDSGGFDPFAGAKLGPFDTPECREALLLWKDHIWNKKHEVLHAGTFTAIALQKAQAGWDVPRFLKAVTASIAGGWNNINEQAELKPAETQQPSKPKGRGGSNLDTILGGKQP